MVDVHDEMLAMTLGIVGETLFGAHMESQSVGDRGGSWRRPAIGPAALVPFGNWMLRLPIPPARRLRRAKSRLDDVVSGIIADRRRAGNEDRGDLLSILLNATLSDDPADAAMNDQQLADEVMTMFVAGYRPRLQQ